MTAQSEIDTILATDVGSTTSKAILIKKVNGEFRLVGRGEAPTTVEAPFEDVRVGVRNAVKQVEDLTGIHFLTREGALKEGHARPGPQQLAKAAYLAGAPGDG